ATGIADARDLNFSCARCRSGQVVRRGLRHRCLGSGLFGFPARETKTMSFAIETSTLIALAAGLVIVLTAWLPLVLRRAPLSLPIIAIALGYMLFSCS